MSRIYFLLLVVISSLHLATSSAWSASLYWTDWGTDKIQSSDLDGSNVDQPITGLDAPADIALDVNSGKMYWTEANTKLIKRANLDGTGIETVLTLGTSSTPWSIALDPPRGKMYWTSKSDKKIQRANLNGTSLETVVTDFPSGGIDGPRGLAVDSVNEKIYWTEHRYHTAIDRIRRADLNGSNIDELVTGLKRPNGIALDIPGNRMFWVESGGKVIQSAWLDGTSSGPRVSTGLVGPHDIALDLAGGKMYWTDSGTDSIRRANVDGSNVETIVSGLSAPFGIAIVPEPSSIALALMGLIGLAAYDRRRRRLSV